jgi:hypothetical protein
MNRTGTFIIAGLVLLLLASAASAYVRHRHHHHAAAVAASHAQIKHHASRRQRHFVHRDVAPLGCLPAELRAKVVEIVGACGTHIIRTFTPGAIIAGTSHLSEHAFCRAADLAGNPICIYAHLRGFRGGYSIDYGRMRHVHVSWHPGGWEQGVRFVHGGGSATSSVVAFAHR